MKYEIITHDGKTYEISQDDPEVIRKLAKKLELVAVTLHDGRVEYFAKGNVARIQSKYKASDATQIAAKADIDRRADINSEAYKKFQEAKNKIGRNKYPNK